jgi:hypothetical protein
MALTYVNYTATADQTDFAVTFPYLETTHIKVSIEGASVAAEDYVVVETPSVLVRLDTGAAASEVVQVHRVTPGRTSEEKDLLVDFQDGSVLTEADLDKACTQLIYLTQEAEEAGTSNLPLDYDGNYLAGGKRLKNLGSSVSDTDAVTKGYADALALYGGATIPQYWSKTGADFSNPSSNTYTLVLTDPVPNSDTDSLFLVALGGVLQRPTTDFTVSESAGVFTLTITGWATYEADDPVSIQNFGFSRNVALQPFENQPGETTAVTLVSKAITDQTGDLQQWQDTGGSALAKIAADGDATVVDLTATGDTTVVDLTATGDSALSKVTLGHASLLRLQNTQNIPPSTTDPVGGDVPHHNDTPPLAHIFIDGYQGNGFITHNKTGLWIGQTGIGTRAIHFVNQSTERAKLDSEGNFDILTGALKFAGQTGMTIRQIVAGVDIGSADEIITNASTFKVAGKRISITPSVSTSTLIILGAARIKAQAEETSYAGVVLKVYALVGTQNSIGSSVDGASVGISGSYIAREIHDNDKSDEQHSFFTVPISCIHVPGSTSAIDIDIAIYANNAATKSVELNRSECDFFAIEIA